MTLTKDYCRQFLGQCVHCHSMYGVHHGYVHRVLRDGIILVEVTRLASSESASPEAEHSLYDGQSTDSDIANVQFILPAPGLFLPYAGVYGLYRPGFII